MLSPGHTTLRSARSVLSMLDYQGILCAISLAGIHLKVPAWCIGSWIKLRKRGVSSGCIQAINSVPESILGPLEGLNHETYLLK